MAIDVGQLVATARVDISQYLAAYAQMKAIRDEFINSSARGAPAAAAAPPVSAADITNVRSQIGAVSELSAAYQRLGASRGEADKMAAEEIARQSAVTQANLNGAAALNGLAAAQAKANETQAAGAGSAERTAAAQEQTAAAYATSRASLDEMASGIVGVESLDAAIKSEAAGAQAAAMGNAALGEEVTLVGAAYNAAQVPINDLRTSIFGDAAARAADVAAIKEQSAAMGASNGAAAGNAASLLRVTGSVNDAGAAHLRLMGPLGLVAAGFAIVGGAVVEEMTKMQESQDRIVTFGDVSQSTLAQVDSSFGTTIDNANTLDSALAPVSGRLQLIAGAGGTSAAATQTLAAAQVLAAGSGEKLDASEKAIVDTLRNFNLTADSSSQVAGGLLQASQLTGESVSAMSQQFGQLHSQLAAFNPDFETTKNLIIAAGESGGDSQRNVRDMASGFESLVKPSNDAAKAIKANQLAITDAHGAMLPLNVLVAEFATKFGTLGDAQQLAALRALGFRDAAAAQKEIIAAAALNTDHGRDSLIEYAKAQQVAQDHADSLGGRLEHLGGSIVELATKVGVTAVGAFYLFKGVLSEFGRDVGDFANDLQQLIKGLADFIEKTVTTWAQKVEGLIKQLEKAPAIGGLVTAALKGIDDAVSSLAQSTTQGWVGETWMGETPIGHFLGGVGHGIDVRTGAPAPTPDQGSWIQRMYQAGLAHQTTARQDLLPPDVQAALAAAGVDPSKLTPDVLKALAASGGAGAGAPGAAAPAAPGAGAAGVLPATWLAALQQHESGVPLPAPGAPSTMFGIGPGFGFPTHVYHSEGSSGSSFEGSLFPDVGTGISTLMSWINRNVPNWQGYVQSGDFTGLLQGMVAGGYAGPGEGPAFVSQTAGGLSSVPSDLVAAMAAAGGGGGGGSGRDTGGGYPYLTRPPQPGDEALGIPPGAGYNIPPDQNAIDAQIKAARDAQTEVGALQNSFNEKQRKEYHTVTDDTIAQDKQRTQSLRAETALQLVAVSQFVTQWQAIAATGDAAGAKTYYDTYVDPQMKWLRDLVTASGKAQDDQTADEKQQLGERRAAQEAYRAQIKEDLKTATFQGMGTLPSDLQEMMGEAQAALGGLFTQLQRSDLTPDIRGQLQQQLDDVTQNYDAMLTAGNDYNKALEAQQKAQVDLAKALRAEDLSDVQAKNAAKLQSDLDTIQRSTQQQVDGLNRQADVENIKAQMYAGEAQYASDALTKQKDTLQQQLAEQTAVIEQNEAKQIQAIRDDEQQKLRAYNDVLLQYQEADQTTKGKLLEFDAYIAEERANIDIATTRIMIDNQKLIRDANDQTAQDDITNLEGWLSTQGDVLKSLNEGKQAWVTYGERIAPGLTQAGSAMDQFRQYTDNQVQSAQNAAQASLAMLGAQNELAQSQVGQSAQITGLQQQIDALTVIQDEQKLSTLQLDQQVTELSDQNALLNDQVTLVDDRFKASAAYLANETQIKTLNIQQDQAALALLALQTQQDQAAVALLQQTAALKQTIAGQTLAEAQTQLAIQENVNVAAQAEATYYKDVGDNLKLVTDELNAQLALSEAQLKASPAYQALQLQINQLTVAKDELATAGMKNATVDSLLTRLQAQLSLLTSQNTLANQGLSVQIAQQTVAQDQNALLAAQANALSPVNVALQEQLLAQQDQLKISQDELTVTQDQNTVAQLGLNNQIALMQAQNKLAQNQLTSYQDQNKLLTDQNALATDALTQEQAIAKVQQDQLNIQQAQVKAQQDQLGGVNQTLAALQAQLALAQALQRVQPAAAPGGGYGQPTTPYGGVSGYGQPSSPVLNPPSQPPIQSWWNPGPYGPPGTGTLFTQGTYAGMTVVEKLQVVIDGQVVQELVLRNLNTGATLNVGITQGQIP